MSCYDRVYDDTISGSDVLMKAKKVTDSRVWIRSGRKMKQWMKGKAFSWRTKYSFYKSYRGSLKQLGRRFLHSLRRKTAVRLAAQQNGRKDVSIEMQQAKQKLRERLRVYQ
jgi:hypothetical protein